MRLSSEMAMSARSRNSRRIVIIQSSHHTSITPHQVAVSQILQQSDPRDELDHSSQVHTENSFKPCVTAACFLDNQSHSFITRLLSPRNYDSLLDESKSSSPSPGRAAKKAKSNIHKKAKKIQIVKKPLHTVLKAIAHKPIHPIAHHSNKLIAPAQPVPVKETNNHHVSNVQKPLAPIPATLQPEIFPKPTVLPAQKPLVKPAVAVPLVPTPYNQPVQVLSKSSTPASPPPAPSPTNKAVHPSISKTSTPASTPLAPSQAARPPTSREPSAVEPVNTVLAPQKTELPLSKPSILQPNNIPVVQDPTSDRPAVHDVEAPMPQSSLADLSPSQLIQDPSSKDTTPPPFSSAASQDSSSPTTDENPVQQLTLPVATAQLPTSQEPPTPLTSDFSNPAPAPDAISPATLQHATLPVSPFVDGISNFENSNVAIAQPPSPLVDSTQDSLALASPSNNGVLLNNGTRLTNSTSSSVKTNFNGLNSGNTPPTVPAADAGTNHTGAAVGGVFGSLAFIALVAGLFIMISRRRRTQQRGTSSRQISENAPNGPADNQRTMTEVNSGISPRALAVDHSFDELPEARDEQMMSPVDPVTRFSQGGFSLLKRLEGIAEDLDRSVHSASPDGGSSDDDPIEMMVGTPTSAEFSRRPFSSTELKSDVQMGTVEPTTVSPLLFPTDTDGSVEARAEPGGDYPELQLLDDINRASGGTDTSYATGGITISSGYEQAVKFEDGSEDNHEDSIKAGSEQAWWGVQQPVVK